ncbi:MAG: hypothetical protein K2M45_05400 [Muribaculaceae bacterium]|nr:hypothetical protein [Muribaculaceae bacterium]
MDPISLISIHNLIGLVSFVMIIVGLINARRLMHRTKGTPTSLNVKIEGVSDRSQDYINSLSSIITIFSVACLDFNGIRGVILLAVVLFVIYVCTINSNWYYCNPIFALMNFHIDVIHTNMESRDLPNGSIVLYQGDIKKDVYVTPYHISDNVYLITIPQNKVK